MSDLSNGSANPMQFVVAYCEELATTALKGGIGMFLPSYL